MKKLFLASVMMTATMMTQAGAADMAVKAPRAAPIQYSDWSGFYVGIEGGYGWGSRSFNNNLDGANIFGNSGFAAPTSGGNGVVNNAFVMPNGSTLTNKNGWLAGGFFGGQKQYGSWVFGIEGDVNATDISNSFRATGTRNETVTAVNIINPITNVGGINATGTNTAAFDVVIAGQTNPVTGLTVTNAPGSITLPSQALNIGGQTVVIPGQTVQLTGVPNVPTFNADGQPTGQFVPASPGALIPAGSVITLTLPGGGTLAFTVPVGFTVPTNGLVTIPVGTLTTQNASITIPPQNITIGGQTITIPAQIATVAGGTVTTQPRTITIPPGTLAIATTTNPGQTRPLLLPNGQTAFVPVLGQGLAAVTRTVAVDTKIDMLSSVRGRVGFTPWDSVLIYGTGGLALAHASATSTITQSTAAFDIPGLGTIGATSNTSKSSTSGTMLGWALGAGLDFKVTPNVFVGVEYLHYDFPKNAFAFTDGKGAGFSLNNDHMQVDAVKARVGFLFN